MRAKTTRRAVTTAAAVAALSAGATSAAAHELRPAILDVTHLEAGRYEVIWTAPSGAEPGEAGPSFPEGCRREPGEGARFVIDCGPPGLGGRIVTVHGLGVSGVDALVRFTGPGGPATAVLRADSPSFVVPTLAEPAATSRFTRARSYLGAGVAHILHGADHLLFVLGLLLLVRGPAALVRTVTAFTIAHSVTLALAVTAAVRLPPAPVEAAIALSLVLLAGELARPAPSTLATRRPALLAFAFGLLHGFGFAGGLAELRVPAPELPLALAGFNLGVEAGQLAFVAAILATVTLLRRALRPVQTARIVRVPAYAIGSIGVVLLIERVLAFWSS